MGIQTKVRPTAERETRVTTAKTAPRRRLRLRYVLLAATLVFAAYDYVHVQRPQLVQLQQQELQLERQVASLQGQQKQLQQRIRQLRDDRFIARYASEHFNLVLPGQVAFTVKH